ncbi:COG2426 family protein [Oceanivirga salmonicida]|uniref:COG2426 family protein n=1 Tax=Oceanivirga salmonicida TaxID=1769291 RepID=UPI00082F0FD7|nr:small multi-drug export protein [Oceanivirga salmonicida]
MKYIYLFIISMTPFLELRGAIITAVALDLNLGLASIVCIIGNIIVMPIIFVFAKRFLIYGVKYKYLGPIFEKILKKGHETGQNLLNKSSTKTYIALFLFVGIPLPGTGVWTGTLGASMLDLGFRKSFVSIFFGTIMSCTIMIMLSKFGFSIGNMILSYINS